MPSRALGGRGKMVQSDPVLGMIRVVGGVAQEGAVKALQGFAGRPDAGDFLAKSLSVSGQAKRVNCPRLDSHLSFSIGIQRYG